MVASDKTSRTASIKTPDPVASKTDSSLDQEETSPFIILFCVQEHDRLTKNRTEPSRSVQGIPDKSIILAPMPMAHLSRCRMRLMDFYPQYKRYIWHFFNLAHEQGRRVGHDLDGRLNLGTSLSANPNSFVFHEQRNQNRICSGKGTIKHSAVFRSRIWLKIN